MRPLCPQGLSQSPPSTQGYLSSVLSAREMAGFRRALLHAWLFLQGGTGSAPPRPLNSHPSQHLQLWKGHTRGVMWL